MIVLTKKKNVKAEGQTMVSVRKSTHQRLVALSRESGRSMAEILALLVTQARVRKNGGR